MTNYRRLISYIYAYEGNTKGKNIGFAKLESRNGQCKLSVNVKKVYVGSSDLEVYLLAPGGEISLGSIFIRGGSGEFRAVISVENAADSGCGLDQCYGLTIHEKDDTWRAYTTIWEDAVAHAAEVELSEVTSGNLGNSEEQIHKKVEELAEEINDKVLSSSGEPVLPRTMPPGDTDREPVQMTEKGGKEDTPVRESAAEETGPLKAEAVKEKTGPLKTEAVKEGEMLEAGNEDLSGEIPQEQTVVSLAEALPEDGDINSITAEKPAQSRFAGGGRPRPVVMSDTVLWKQRETHQRPAMHPGTSTQAQPEDQGGKKVLSMDSRGEEIPLGNRKELERLEQEEQENPGPRQLWEEFRSRYPKIQAFDSMSGCEILTVKPQDIGLLPRENWNYGNNSFLLHGYYNYRYLILARIGDESQGRTRYILGVPGHYYSNEKYMASMFGFPHFVLSKKQPSEDGRFGYWYTDVRMQNQD